MRTPSPAGQFARSLPLAFAGVLLVVTSCSAPGTSVTEPAWSAAASAMPATEAFGEASDSRPVIDCAEIRSEVSAQSCAELNVILRDIDRHLSRIEADDARLDRDLQRLLENAAFQQIKEHPQSFNMQYLGLQQKMQDEARRFSLISNIMKTKHDTAKNSIGNIRE